MAKSKKADRTEAIINKAAEQLSIVLNKNWADIERIMGADSGEISINSKITITDRTPKPGEQATLDNRIKTTISFAEKHSDSCESEIPNPEQAEMNMGA